MLTNLGKEEYIREGFGMIYYQLWFEFIVMAEGSFQERIKEEDIMDFPRDRNKQLDALKKMCLACNENYVVNSEQDIL